jgi:MFS family permease
MARWLVAILLVSLCMNCVGVEWGLPNGNSTWAVDSLQPLTPAAVATRALWTEKWNSGWFYFKYPLGHPFVLLGAQLPYLAWLWLTDQVQSPTSTYPYGFRHPERALTVLALLSRAVSVLMGVGVVALAYYISASLFGTSAGLAAAVLVTGCAPFTFYAHTANVDMPLLFWIALAIAAVLVSADRASVRGSVIAGAAAGMAFVTKEQCVGALIPLPFVWVVCSWSHGVPRWRTAARHAAIAGAGFLAVSILVGGIWRNPTGYVNRWRFLLGTLPPHLRDRYAPYQYPLYAPTPTSLSGEIGHLLKVVHAALPALTVPVVLLCVVGTVWSVWRRPRQAAIPLLLSAAYYLFSARATPLMQVRYIMPLLYFVLILGGAGGGAILDGIRRVPRSGIRRVATVLVVAAIGCAFVPGIEVDRLLINDPRYRAEEWLRAHAPVDAHVEVYQRPTHLPRFSTAERVVRVPLRERTVPLFEERRPDLVVLSSGGRAGLIAQHPHDWQRGEPVMVDFERAKEFFARLRDGQLGYRRVARFHTPTRWVECQIESLNPEITIFGREQPGRNAMGK